MTDLEVAELLGSINRLTRERDLARDIAVRLEQENHELLVLLTQAVLT